MIRLRVFKDLAKVHQLMRKLPKIIALDDSRKELLHVANDVESEVDQKDHFDADGAPLSGPDIDGKWADLNRRL